MVVSANRLVKLKPSVFGQRGRAAAIPLEAVRSIDMSAFDYAATYRRSREADLEQDGAQAELKKLVPEDAKETFGH